jgi:cell division septation protein DedD
MSDNDDNRLLASGSDSDEPGADHPQKSTRREAHDESGYTRFDEQDDDYEEPDRDTDCATIYTEDEDEEYYLDDPEPVAADIFSERKTGGHPDPEPGSDWEEDDEEEWDREERWDDEVEATAEERYGDEWDEKDDARPGVAAPAAGLSPRREMMDPDLDWQEEDAYADEAVEDTGMWPLSLIAVAVVAVLLLAAGGYGVLQQRAAMQEEIRQLQADLATAVTPAEAAASREASRDLEQRNDELQARLEALTIENRRLEGAVSGLEARLEERTAEAQKPAAPAATAPAPEAPAPAAKPAPARPAAPEKAPVTATGAAVDGGWFVNFGSYSQRAMAESWADRLQPQAGKVVVTTGSKGGELFYRVRVIDLASREQAERTARKLEGDYGLSRLWVGSD